MRMKSKLPYKCVYFAPAGVDRSGQPKYAPPTQLDCRWEDTEEVKQPGSSAEWVSKAQVYLDTEVEKQGVLVKLEYDDLDDFENPFANESASTIQAVEIIPPLKRRSRQKPQVTAYL